MNNCQHTIMKGTTVTFIDYTIPVPPSTYTDATWSNSDGYKWVYRIDDNKMKYYDPEAGWWPPFSPYWVDYTYENKQEMTFSEKGIKSIGLNSANSDEQGDSHWDGLVVVDCGLTATNTNTLLISDNAVHETWYGYAYPSFYCGKFVLGETSYIVSSDQKRRFSACDEITLTGDVEIREGSEVTFEINDCLQNGGKSVYVPVSLAHTKILSNNSIANINGNDNQNNFVFNEDWLVYPNPFSNTALIAYTGQEIYNVEIAIYNLMGKKIITLFKGQFPLGANSVIFDGTDLPDGVYICACKTKSNTKNLKLIKSGSLP